MTFSLEFLAWCNRCLFRLDFEKDLKRLGVPFKIYYAISSSEVWRKHPCILGLYQNFINYDEAKEALEKWLAMMQLQYDLNAG